MKSINNFIRKNLLTSIMIFLLFIIINIIMILIGTYNLVKENNEYKNPNQIAKNIIIDINNNRDIITINNKSIETLNSYNSWAILIDDNSGKVIWEYKRPKEVPIYYSRKNIALFTRYYIKDYPVFTYTNNKGLLVLGFPKDSYSKVPGNYYRIDIINKILKYILFYLLLNLVILLIIYIISKRRLLKSILPITKAICNLPKGNEIYLTPKGDLSFLIQAINETSSRLKSNATMRTNWISGVSHDIRTPLSLIMGYSNEISKGNNLTNEEKRKLSLIQSNSEIIKYLIENLNMATRLEYGLTLFREDPINLVKSLREIIVDIMNENINNNYLFDFHCECTSPLIITGDKKLLDRIFRNIFYNSMKYNPNGCEISIKILKLNNNIQLSITDDGIGCNTECLHKLNQPTTYQIKEKNKKHNTHGLGLLIARQIVELHNGNITFSGNIPSGLCVTINFPVLN